MILLNFHSTELKLDFQCAGFQCHSMASNSPEEPNEQEVTRGHLVNAMNHRRIVLLSDLMMHNVSPTPWEYHFCPLTTVGYSK